MNMAPTIADAPCPKQPFLYDYGTTFHSYKTRSFVLNKLQAYHSPKTAQIRKTTANLGKDGLTDLVETHKPALVLLDLMLPGTDGIELMQSVPQLADLPVIFISAYGRDETIARALELGAADYIVKPFSPTELTARVRAALRRRAEPERFLLRDLAIDYEQRKVTVAGQSVQLTASEYELLRLLSVNAGRVLTPEALLRRLRGGQDAADSTVVRTLVKKLRRKLGDNAARPAYVLTERGVGYRMATPADS